MKKLLLLLSIFIMVSGSFAKDKENSESKIFNLNNNFTAIEISGNIRVDYEIGDTPRAVAKTEPGYMDYLHIDIRHKTLTISFSPKTNTNVSAATVYVTGPQLSKYLSGTNCKLLIKSDVNTHTLKATANGNASLIFDNPIKATDAMITTKDNGEIKLDKADIDNLTINTSVNAIFTSDQVKATKFTAHISGNSSMKIKNTFSAATADISSKDNAQVEFQNADINRLSINTLINSIVKAKAVSAYEITAYTYSNSNLSISGSADKCEFTSEGNSEIDASKLAVKSGSVCLTQNSKIKSNIRTIISQESTGNSQFRNRN